MATRIETCCDPSCENYNVPQVIELTAEEVAALEAAAAEAEADRIAAEAEAAAKEAAKAELLSKLGITADEAKLLLS